MIRKRIRVLNQAHFEPGCPPGKVPQLGAGGLVGHEDTGSKLDHDHVGLECQLFLHQGRRCRKNQDQ